MLTRLKERFDSEPVMITAALRAIILAGTAFGLDWTGEQVAAVMLAVELVIAVFTRARVTPNASVPPSVNAGRFVPVVLLAVVIGAGTVGCAGKNIAPELVASQDAVHDALAAAQDTIEPYCRDAKIEAIRVPCVETNKVLVPALRAGRAYSQAVLSERAAGLGQLVEEIGRLITAVRGIPSREIRVRVIADLQRAIDEAFKGAR